MYVALSDIHLTDQRWILLYVTRGFYILAHGKLKCQFSDLNFWEDISPKPSTAPGSMHTSLYKKPRSIEREQFDNLILTLFHFQPHVLKACDAVDRSDTSMWKYHQKLLWYLRLQKQKLETKTISEGESNKIILPITWRLWMPYVLSFRSTILAHESKVLNHSPIHYMVWTQTVLKPSGTVWMWNVVLWKGLVFSSNYQSIPKKCHWTN
jgi:hypothetical protein